jgi:hypothetical protein
LWIGSVTRWIFETENGMKPPLTALTRYLHIFPLVKNPHYISSLVGKSSYLLILVVPETCFTPPKAMIETIASPLG